MWLTLVVYIPLFYESRDAADWGYLLSPAFFVATAIIVVTAVVVGWMEKRIERKNEHEDRET